MTGLGQPAGAPPGGFKPSAPWRPAAPPRQPPPDAMRPRSGGELRVACRWPIRTTRDISRGITNTLKRMTKSQLIDAVSAKTGREKPEVEAVLESVLGAIAEALQANQRVDLRGFGGFAVKQKKERQGRNPRTGETITIAAKRDARFKAGKELSETLIQRKSEDRAT